MAAGKRFVTGHHMQMPAVRRNTEVVPRFVEGSNRYLWMQEHSALAMPVAVLGADAEVVQVLCGTRRRTSSFIPPHPRLPTVVVFGILCVTAAGLVAVTCF
ncbi:hypothetical protein FV219_00390 [Methylobacterium sp. WL122]|nr:hypothetical protein FV219_00390 [Methylobacterium sp. WL122]